jgi:hypothetical protein
VVLGVQLAGFTGMMRRVNGMAGGHMGVVARGFGFVGLMGLGGVAVMLGRLFVKVGCVGVMLVGVVRSHRRSSLGWTAAEANPGLPEHRAT